MAFGRTLMCSWGNACVHRRRREGRCKRVWLAALGSLSAACLGGHMGVRCTRQLTFKQPTAAIALALYERIVFNGDSCGRGG